MTFTESLLCEQQKHFLFHSGCWQTRLLCDSCPQLSHENNNLSHLSSSWRCCKNWQVNVSEVCEILRWTCYINLEECCHFRPRPGLELLNKVRFSGLGAVCLGLCYSGGALVLITVSLTHSPLEDKSMKIKLCFSWTKCLLISFISFEWRTTNLRDSLHIKEREREFAFWLTNNLCVREDSWKDIQNLKMCVCSG